MERDICHIDLQNSSQLISRCLPLAIDFTSQNQHSLLLSGIQIRNNRGIRSLTHEFRSKLCLDNAKSGSRCLVRRSQPLHLDTTEYARGLRDFVSGLCFSLIVLVRL
jgi:hypothetical protein